LAGNSDPIYSKVADIQAASFIATAANADSTGAGTLQTLYQSDVTNGGFVQKIIVKPIATTAAATTATVMRFFLSNITGTWTGSTASNTWLIGELSLVSSTLSATAAQTQYEFMVNYPIPPGWRIVVGFGTTLAASTGYAASVIAGKY
jgi:hypothetical protein